MKAHHIVPISANQTKKLLFQTRSDNLIISFDDPTQLSLSANEHVCKILLWWNRPNISTEEKYLNLSVFAKIRDWEGDKMKPAELPAELDLF